MCIIQPLIELLSGATDEKPIQASVSLWAAVNSKSPVLPPVKKSAMTFFQSSYVVIISKVCKHAFVSSCSLSLVRNW